MDSPLSIVDSQLRDKAHRICRGHLGGAWERVSPSEMSFTPISGGMSNLLYCCSLPESIKLLNGEPSQVLLRIYGDQNCDMSVQVKIFKLLSKKDLGPKLFGDFGEGRLEEFLTADSLTSQELMDRDISCIIARKLASVHSLDVPLVKNKSWLLDRFREWLEFIEQNSNKVQFADGTRHSTREIAKKLLSVNFAKEFTFLKNILDRSSSPIVFSHNDLHQGNILLAKPSKRRPKLDKRVILIDFEYCSYNYRGYDIANHFCEWCFEYDTPDYPHFRVHEDRFPSKETQREFIRNYLEQQNQLTKQTKTNFCTSANGTHTNNNYRYLNANGNGTNHHYSMRNGNANGNSVRGSQHSDRRISGFDHATNINGTTLKDKSQNVSVDPQDVEKILDEVRPFCMAANFVWTLWCIKSAYSTGIKFGYWEHAIARWQLYSNLKASYLKDKALAFRENGCNIPRE